MSILTYHILSNPNVLEKLRKELETVFPDPEVLPSCGKIFFLCAHSPCEAINKRWAIISGDHEVLTDVNISNQA